MWSVFVPAHNIFHHLVSLQDKLQIQPQGERQTPAGTDSAEYGNKWHH